VIDVAILMTMVMLAHILLLKAENQNSFKKIEAENQNR